MAFNNVIKLLVILKINLTRVFDDGLSNPIK